MSHARPRLGRYSLVLAITMLLVSAVSAHATTVNIDSGTLVVTGGDNLQPRAAVQVQRGRR